MPKLYATRRSRASRNFWLAEELGLTFEVVPVWQAYRLDDPLAADAPQNTLSPAFLALSPAGAIPVLEDDGLRLTESLAINLHLARRHGGDLGPQDAAEDALMQQWALFGATSIEDAALAVQTLVARGADPSTDLARLARPLDALAAHLAATPYIVGNRFTVADINMAEIIRYMTAAPGALDTWPAVATWLAACQARPAFQRMWAAREAEPARPPV